LKKEHHEGDHRRWRRRRRCAARVGRNEGCGGMKGGMDGTRVREKLSTE